MSRLIITRGLPAAGKTTLARRWVAGAPAGERARVNRDDLRAMCHNGMWSGKTTEQWILLARDAVIEGFLRGGVDVICDDTNVDPGIVDLIRFGRDCAASVELADFTHIDAWTCFKRDQRRPGPEQVGREVIWRMRDRLVASARMDEVRECLLTVAKMPDLAAYGGP